MQERHLLACARYVELNPVRAGLVKKVDKWPWSSAAAHIKGRDDILVKAEPLLSLVAKPWRDYLDNDVQEAEMEQFRRHERTGRPLGENTFIGQIERQLRRELKPKKPGPKRIAT